MLDEIAVPLARILNYPLVTLGDSVLTLSGMLTFLELILAVFVGEHVLRRYIVRRLLSRTRLDLGLQYAMARMLGYCLLVLGVYISLQIVGLDLGSLAFIAGAIGVGIGFGLQNIINNFVSGIIILAERPISLGDRIEVGGVAGQVEKISLRSTTVITNDNIAMIVPNGEFISSTVTNWSHRDDKTRFRIPVGVHYNSDVHLVEKALLEAASECEDVLKNPGPAVRFLEFGDSSLNFELRVWSVTIYKHPNLVRSKVNFLIWDKFKKYDIEIPYPQQDLYIKELPPIETPGIKN
jgi:small-conductance mechanosensitive channel